MQANTRRALRGFYFFMVAVQLCILPWSFHLAFQHHWSVKYFAFFLGACFVVLAVPISIYQVACHLENFARPQLQRHVVRILWMVPVYCLDAWFSLVFKDAQRYMDPLREFYEAYVIYNFYRYLVHFMEDEVGDLVEWMSQQPQQQHIALLRYIIPPWQMGEQFLFQCRSGVLAYVVVRPLMTILEFGAKEYDKLYGDGTHWMQDNLYPYATVLTSLSQAYALYSLALFYHATHNELKAIKPLKKFIVIKLVVFFSFWQGVVVAILAHFNKLPQPESLQDLSQKRIGVMLQDLLICIEMAGAAVAHEWTFSYKDYLDPSVPARGMYANLGNMWDVRDVMVDIGDVADQATKSTAAQIARAGRTTVSTATNVLVKKPLKAVKGYINPQVSYRFDDDDPAETSRQPLLAGSQPGGAEGMELEPGQSGVPRCSSAPSVASGTLRRAPVAVSRRLAKPKPDPEGVEFSDGGDGA